ncbi:MAG: thiamine-monophosphate kinase [Planctomycetes bacterium]|nr:thiamine-monophosphate kinase [Planctomycetota bacterium]
MKESDLIAAIRSRVTDPSGVIGIGDDCCVWTPSGQTCLSVDTIVEGRHFRASDEPGLVGRKAAGAALSDLAAMGARPIGAVVALSCPARWDGLAVMDGLIAELRRHGCALLGGDTTGSEALVISVTVWGERASARFLTRSGAAAGDLLVVTGPLGGSLRSGRHLRPQPRFAEGQWLADQPYVRAMMDLSDGLAADAPKLAEASGCGCLLLPQDVPVHPDVPEMADGAKAACCDGEDFELLAAVSAEQWPHLQLAWPFPRQLARVGWLLDRPGTFMEDRQGRVVPMTWTGFEHA